MSTQSQTHFKKKIIAALLGLSCMMSILILAFTGSRDETRLRHINQVDTLLMEEFSRFNILPGQIDVRRITVDSNFVRQNYIIDVPTDFSKTQLHSSLKEQFHDFEVSTPARVQFPGETMQIHLTYNNTVFRTIRLQNDTTLTMRRIPASILLFFNEKPTTALIDEIVRLGEPIPIVVKINNTMQADELQKSISKQYSRIAYWLEDNEGNTLTRRTDQSVFMSNIRHLKNVDPNARILVFNPLDQSVSPSFSSFSNKQNVAYLDMSDALIMDSGINQFSFRRHLQRLMQRAQETDNPVSLVVANDQTLNWLHELLPELKKQGLYLTSPPEKRF